MRSGGDLECSGVGTGVIWIFPLCRKPGLARLMDAPKFLVTTEIYKKITWISVLTCCFLPRSYGGHPEVQALKSYGGWICVQMHVQDYKTERGRIGASSEGLRNKFCHFAYLQTIQAPGDQILRNLWYRDDNWVISRVVCNQRAGAFLLSLQEFRCFALCAY